MLAPRTVVLCQPSRMHSATSGAAFEDCNDSSGGLPRVSFTLAHPARSASQTNTISVRMPSPTVLNKKPNARLGFKLACYRKARIPR